MNVMSDLVALAAVAALFTSIGFIAGAGWNAMFHRTPPLSPDHPVFQPPEGHYVDSGYPGTGTDIEAWGTD